MRNKIQNIVDYIRYRMPTLDLQQLNSILYYSDYLSVTTNTKTITEGKYHFIYNMPYNSTLLAEYEPIQIKHIDKFDTNRIDIDDKDSIDKAIGEYRMIEKQFGNNGVTNFIHNICDIKGKPTIDGLGMLLYITQEWDRKDRQKIINQYKDTKNNQIYKCKGEGNTQIECTKYI